jgi:two-component system chemotaxis response regulator CheB
MDLEHRYARAEQVDPERDGAVGQLTTLTCPECHGPLWEVRADGPTRFRCRTGHAFTIKSMLAEQANALEEALWMALNTLEEQALTADRLRRSAEERRHHRVAARFAERAAEARRHAAVLRQVIVEDDDVQALVEDEAWEADAGVPAAKADTADS